ncbi:aminotriazole resistance protein [Tricladium varicosporioides]|nr:aminotriazole resistance protein [Hymenoscyphus varicosporioides]
MASVDAGLTAVDSQTQPPLPPAFEETKQDAGKRPDCFSSTIQECLFVLTATMSIGMSSFLYGSNTVITASIGRDLNMSSAEITWINASSSLSSGAFLLFFAKIADTFGRRSLLIFSMGAFSISTLIAGFATNAMYLDIFCGLLGLWSAAAVPAAVGILGAAYPVPSKRKNYAFACFSAGNPVGFVMGSILSGVAANLFSWRASFWLLAIIYAVFFLAAIWTVPKTQAETERFTLGTLKRFDLFGILLSMAGIALFCASLTLAGDAPKGWRTSYVLVLLILGVLLIFSFIAWEGWCKYPLMPLHIWRDRNFSLINVIVLLGLMSFTTNSFWLSLYMQNVLHFSALNVAIHLLPQAIGGILINIIAGLILHRVNNRLLTAIGALAYAGSSALYATMGTGSSYWAFIFPSLLLSVVGADFQFNVANMYVMSSLPPHQQSLAGGIFNTITKVCSALGLGISASIYNSESVGHAALQTELKPYRSVFYFTLAAAGCGLIVCWWLSIGTQGHSGGSSVVGLESEEKGEKVGTEGDKTEVKKIVEHSEKNA